MVYDESMKVDVHSHSSLPVPDTAAAAAEVVSYAASRKNLKYYNHLIAENAKRKRTKGALKLFQQLKEQVRLPRR